MNPSPLCQDCGTPLSAGACPACALGQLLHGSSQGGESAGDSAGITAAAGEMEFGRYTLKRRLAAGGMGVVYVADDLKLKRTVALKMIRGSTFANEAELARFTIEAEAAAALDHPNIVPIYEVGRYEDQPFFTMKLIEGQCLAERLRSSGGKLPVRELATLLSAIARAVHHAHQRGVLHRDLKPGNILLDQSGVPWLTDFGLAKLAHAESGLTLSTDHIGTPHYMSPEIAGGTARQASTASDVWALGVLLWEMLSGTPPFHGNGALEIMRRIVDHEPYWPGPERGDEDLVTLARRCMEKDPARRPDSAGEVADELDRWLRGEPIKARPVTRGERFLKWVRRKPALAALYAALAVGGAASLLLWQRAEGAVVSLKETNKRMEVSLRISTATKLAGDARLQVSEDASRALLLAVEAVEMTEDQGVLPEAASSLMGVLQRAGGFDATPGGLRDDYHTGFIGFSDYQRRMIQISPDSRWQLSLGFAGFDTGGVHGLVVDLKDPRDSAVRRYFKLWPAHPVIPREANFCWLPDSRRILTVTNEGKIGILEVISPAMESGATDNSPPEWTCQWTLPESAETFERLHVYPGGAEGPGVVWHRHLKTGSEIGRVRLTPQGWQEDPVITVGNAPGAGESSWLAPNGRWLVIYCAGQSANVRLVDLADPASPPRLLPLDDCAVTQICFTPDSQHFAIQRQDQDVVCFSLPNSPDGEFQRQEFPSPLGKCIRLALSPDHRWLALSSEDGSVVLHPRAGGGPPVRLKMSAGQASCIQFSADSRWLAAAGELRVVNVWALEGILDGTEPSELFGMATPVCEVQFSPDSQSVIAGGLAEVARRWPFGNRTGAALPQQLPAGTFQALDVAVSPDGEWVASAGFGPSIAGAATAAGWVTVSRVGGSESSMVARHANNATSVAFSRDGRHLASTGRDGNVNVWDFPVLARAIRNGGQSLPTPLFVLSVEGVRLTFDWQLTFHPDGRLYLVNGDGLLMTWDLQTTDPSATRQEQSIHSIGYLLPDAAVSPDGRVLAVSRHGWDQPKAGSVQFGAQVLLFDVSKSWPPVFLTALQADFLEKANVAFSSDSRWLAVGACGLGPCLWDLAARDIAASRIRAPLSANLTAAVAFSPDNTRLAMGGDDGLLYLWNWRLPNDLRTLQTYSAIRCLSWFDDGRLATVGGSAKVNVWDTDIPRLKTLARRIAGRDLSPAERNRFRVSLKER